MPVSTILKSGLKSAVKDLPEDFAVKAQSLPNVLKKEGVKAEELEFSGIDLPTTGKVTKEDLVKAEAGRTDKFEVIDSSTDDYDYYSLHDVKTNPTYREKIYTFEKEGREGYTSHHFPDVPNYLMHTRTFDTTLDGSKTRVVQEIQSDLHQEGRQQGYGAVVVKHDEVNAAIDKFNEAEDFWFTRTARASTEEEVLRETVREKEALRLQEEAITTIKKYIPSFDERVDLTDMRAADLVEHYGTGVPKSPFEKTWLKKAMEREIAEAIQDGREQIAIPIKGPEVERLNRSEGVQKWYETQVESTMRKLAKSQGLTYTKASSGGVTASPKDLEVLKRYKAMDKSDPAYSQLEDDVLDILDKYPTDAGDSFSVAVDKLITPKGRGLNYERWTKESPLVSGDTAEAIANKDVQALKEVARFMPEEYSKLITDNMVDLFEGRTSLRALLSKVDQDTPAVEYGVIKLDKPLKTPMTLYSTPAAGAFFVYQGLKAGYEADELKAELAKDGYDEEDFAEFQRDADFISQAVTAGYSEEEARAELLAEATQEPVEVSSMPTAPVDTSRWTSEPKAMVPQPGKLGDAIRQQQELFQPKGEALANLVDQEKEMTDKELFRSIQIISPNMASMSSRIGATLGDENDQRIVEDAELAMRQRIANLAADRGLQVYFDMQQGKWLSGSPENPGQELDETFFEGLESVAGEIAGAVAGGIFGFAMGGIPGSVVGAGIGTGIGAGTDYLYNAMQLHEDVNADMVGRKALTAMQVGVAGDILFLGAGKLAGGTMKTAAKAVDFIKNGEKSRAVRALQEEMFLDDGAAEQAVQQLSRMVNLEGMSKAEAKLYATAVTTPRLEELVKAAATIDAKASQAVIVGINKRAEDLLATTKKMTGGDVGKILKEDLANYSQDVKNFYSHVKAQPAKSPKLRDFSFDYDELAIEPALSAVQRELRKSGKEGPLQKFANQAQVIRDMSDSKSFTDLLELRQLINEFRFNKRIKGTAASDELFTILKKVDKSILDGAKVVMEKPNQWLDDYAKARKMYGEMKGVEKNVLSKVLNRPGINEEQVVKQLGTKITAIDNTFEEVIRVLPKQAKQRTENAVVKLLTDKYTIGKGTGNRATHFPLLAEDLKQITFTTPDARKLKQAVIEMGEVFRNDVPLANVTGAIHVPKWQSYLTTDPVVRAKFMAASEMFNRIQQYSPSDSGAAINLVKKTAKVLENPLNSRSIRELMEEAGDKVNIAPQIRELADEAARAQAKGKDIYKVKLYEGPGGIMSTKATKGSTETSVPMHRIATHEKVQEVAEMQGIHPKDKTALDLALQKQGYVAVQQGTDKVRRLK